MNARFIGESKIHRGNWKIGRKMFLWNITTNKGKEKERKRKRN